MKRITPKQTQAPLDKHIAIEMTLAELAEIYVAVGNMSEREYKRLLALPESDLDSVIFNGNTNEELTQYIEESNVFDDIGAILIEEGLLDD